VRGDVSCDKAVGFGLSGVLEQAASKTTDMAAIHLSQRFLTTGLKLN
jgi:hypothetical protein